MSREHAAVHPPDATGCVVEDLGSANGTYVHISTAHKLTFGQMFRVGDEILRLDALARGGLHVD